MIYLIIGLLSGVISGMGIGGGVILIPTFVFICNLTQQQAQNINLIYFIPTAIISLVVHFKNNNIEKNISFKIIIFGIIGAIVGAFFAFKLEPYLLKKFFGFFLLLMGIYELFKRKNNK